MLEKKTRKKREVKEKPLTINTIPRIKTVEFIKILSIKIYENETFELNGIEHTYLELLKFKQTFLLNLYNRLVSMKEKIYITKLNNYKVKYLFDPTVSQYSKMYDYITKNTPKYK